LADKGRRREKPSARKKNKLSNVKVGDIITVDELLGNEVEGPSQLRWLRGKESPFERTFWIAGVCIPPNDHYS
jgi:hypothetical protein